MRNYILALLTVIMLVSACTPPVVFDRPYPTTEKDLKAIPKNYLGTFICESDSALLIIDEADITLRRENFFLLPLKDVEERDDCKISGQEMYVSGRSECIPLEFVGDSLVKGTVVEHDTLFNMGKDEVVRMYKGHVVLSKEVKKGEWAISLLTLQENADIIYRAITDKTKIKNVRRVTTMEDITTEEDKNNRYKIRPTMKQFDRLLSDDRVFIECEYLTRVYTDALPKGPIILDN